MESRTGIARAWLAEWPLILHLAACLYLLQALTSGLQSVRPEKIYTPPTDQHAIDLPSFRDGGFTTHALDWVAGNPGRWSRAPTLQIMMATYNEFRLDTALMELRSASGRCLFRGKPELNDNRFVELRNMGCQVDAGEILTFQVVTEKRARLAVWSNSLPKRLSGKAELYLQRGDEYFVPKVVFVPELEVAATVHRAQAYDYLWDGPATSLYLIGVGLLVWAGLLVRLRARVSLVRQAFVLFCSGLCLIYIVLAPPFQAPDEADHILSFGKINEVEGWRSDTRELAKRGHYERLLCDVDQKFAVSDFGSSLTGQWPKHVMDVPTKKRSPIGYAFWDWLGETLPGVESVGLRILMIRAANVAVLTGVLALLVFFLWQSPVSQGALLSLLALPTVWFFGTHVSNYVFVLCALVVLAVLLVDYTRDEPSLAKGLGVGLGLVLYISASRGSFVFLPFATVMIVMRLVASVWRVSPHFGWWSYRRPVFACMASLVPPMVAVIFLSQTPYLARVAGDARTSTGLLTSGALAILLAPVGIVALVRWLRRFDGWWVRVVALTPKLGWVFVAFGGILLLYPLIKHTPGITDIERVAERVPAFHYGVTVLKSFLQNWGFGGYDFLLIHSFWGGFGCPEPVVPRSMVQGLHAGCLALIVGVVVRDLRTRRYEKVLWHMFVVAALLGYLFALAFATASLRPPFNLHGRYMVGFYLLLVGYGGGHLWWQVRDPLKRLPRVLAVAAVFHAIIVFTLLDRYFGS